MAYVTPAEYVAFMGDVQPIPSDEQERELDAASIDIDGLTFNRIRVDGFDALTEFQKALVQRAVCLQANFRYEFAEIINNPLSSYGINGVSMAWDSKKVLTNGSVTTINPVMAALNQTGLTYRGLC